MSSNKRSLLSLALGAASMIAPLAIWIFLTVVELRRDPTKASQDGMATTFIWMPLALIGAFAFGIPAFVLAIRRTKATGRLAGNVGMGLAVLALVLAFGTCLGPVFLGEWLR
jgi:hypothetical protein